MGLTSTGNGSGTRDRREGTTAVADLEQSRGLLDAVVNGSTDLVFLVDLEHRLLWCNDRFRDHVSTVWGVDPEVGMHVRELADDRQRVEFWIDVLERARRQGSVELEYETAQTGQIVQFTARAMARDGGPYAVCAFGRDVTDERQAQRSLAASEAKYRSVIRSMAEGVVFQDAQGRIIETNPAAQRIEGRGDEDMVGHTSDDPQWGAVREDGSPFPGDEHPAMVTLRTGEPELNVVMGIRRPDGERRWLSINSAPVHQEEDPAPGTRPEAVVTTFHDITDRKRSEAALADHAQRLEASVFETLRTVASMIELRDPYTAGHMQRVGWIARDLATELGWPQERCRLVELAGMVHDVGKIAVPVEILSKPTALSRVERELVQSHVEWGVSILGGISDILPIVEIVAQHHERLDGSGYPHGLRGDEILLEARVLAVADVLESMASHRPYRPALGVEAALTELERHRGTRFDDEMVGELGRMFREDGYELREAHPFRLDDD